MRAQFVPKTSPRLSTPCSPVPPVSEARRAPAGSNHSVSTRAAAKTGRTSPRAPAPQPRLTSTSRRSRRSSPPRHHPHSPRPPAPPRSSPRRTPRGGGVRAARRRATGPRPRTSRSRPSRAPRSAPSLHPASHSSPMFSHALAHPESTPHAPDSPDAASPLSISRPSATLVSAYTGASASGFASRSSRSAYRSVSSTSGSFCRNTSARSPLAHEPPVAVDAHEAVDVEAVFSPLGSTSSRRVASPTIRLAAVEVGGDGHGGAE